MTIPPLTPELFLGTVVGAWLCGYVFGWVARIVHRYLAEFFS